MTWIALDTATDRASVAAEADGAVHRATLIGARRHAEALPRLIDEVLAAAGAALSQVRGIVVADGPGSFTGLRVGAAVAKAIVRHRGVPLRTAPSLLARAWGTAPRDGRVVLVLTDALRGDVYAAAYRLRDDAVITELAPTVLRPEQVRERCPGAAAVVTGAPEALTAAAAPGVPVTSGEAALPDAAALLALRHVRGGTVPVTDVASWEPEYGRPAEAQVRWEDAHGRPLPHSAGARI